MPAEVAQRFRVDPKTVTRWAKSGKLRFIRTLGNHRRYYESEVLALLAGAHAAAMAPLSLEAACVCGCNGFNHVTVREGGVERRTVCRRHHLSCHEFSPVGATR